MANYRGRNADEDDNNRPPALPKTGVTLQKIPIIVGLVLVLVMSYGIYFWFVKRIVVGPGEVMVLTKKFGSTTVPGDQLIIPREPAGGTAEHDAWEKVYGDCNGVLEAVVPAGTYFGFSPFDYEREVISLETTNAIVPGNKVGIVIQKFGAPLDAGQVLADEKRNQRGPLRRVLQPGVSREYANPYAYEIRHVDPISIDAGFRGVVTVMGTDQAAAQSVYNQYLVEEHSQGVQAEPEKEGFLQINPFEKRITPITIRSQRYEMAGADAIVFPSSDSFEIRMEGFVEWSIDPKNLPLVYVQYGEGQGLVEFVEQRVILPYARSFSRLVGSGYFARDFISGDRRLAFQEQFASKLRDACRDRGIEILAARVRDIIPPQAIKAPINERANATEEILKIEQQILFANTESDRVTQQEIGKQNVAIGEANKEVVTVVKKAEQLRDVALTKAQQDLAVAKLKLQAAQKQADATVARGTAEANVILLQRAAEAEPLRRQVTAFGGGDAYARFFFYQQVAPSMKSIMTNTDGPFADLFKQFTSPRPASSAPPGVPTAQGNVQGNDSSSQNGSR